MIDSSELRLGLHTLAHGHLLKLCLFTRPINSEWRKYQLHRGLRLHTRHIIDVSYKMIYHVDDLQKLSPDAWDVAVSVLENLPPIRKSLIEQKFSKTLTATSHEPRLNINSPCAQWRIYIWIRRTGVTPVLPTYFIKFLLSRRPPLFRTDLPWGVFVREAGLGWADFPIIVALFSYQLFGAEVLAQHSQSIRSRWPLGNKNNFW